jgi:hypothetical protein
VERVSSDVVIVEHVDRGAWFSAHFVPIGGRPLKDRSSSVPDVLASAREDFDKIF